MTGGFPGGQRKDPTCDTADTGSIPGSGRSSGGGHGIPLQYSCLENPMDREAWWATVHRVTKSWTELKRLSKHACIPICLDGIWTPCMCLCRCYKLYIHNL